MKFDNSDYRFNRLQFLAYFHFLKFKQNYYTRMAFSGTSRWNHWWRSPNTCCSKKILLLLMWSILIKFSENLSIVYRVKVDFYLTINLVSLAGVAPIIGWLADVRFGRYEIIKFGSLISFASSILFYLEFLNGEGSTLTTVLYSVALIVLFIGSACFTAAILPFLTDQLIGATSDELSTVVQWYAWSRALGTGLATVVCFFGILPNFQLITGAGVAGIYAVPLAVIIISDCLCKQWLDRTHKVTNPIKLIIQVLNYTRKHTYPERRSAFTYIDEEQPTRMDFGKSKFGGPFTEEEVEDVKTVLRFIPLVFCLGVFIGTDSLPAELLVGDMNINLFINEGLNTWFIPVLLIPVYRLLLHRFIHRYTPSMLNSIAIGMVLYILGYIAIEALVIKESVVSNDVQSYLSCTTNTSLTHPLDYYVEWYWKLGPYLLYGVGYTIISVVMYELVIAQSPDKMKGFVLGIMIACNGISILITNELLDQTLCSNLSLTILLVAVFMVFLILSKYYTLRQRNRVINIQAIVEEHYERYMDQEEKYVREQQYFRENFFN